MNMTPGLRKLALTTHVSSSVGWLGAVIAFLALALVGVMSQDAPLVRAVYLAMHPVSWFVIVPLALAAFFTGIVQSLATTWGLVRHYWVAAKLLLTVLATAVLLLHTQAIDRVVAAASAAPLRASDLLSLRRQLVGDASAALFVLFVTTALSVYKPWGMTPYGLRKQFEVSAVRPGMVRAQQDRRARTGRYVVLAIVGFVVLILLFHLAGGLSH